MADTWIVEACEYHKLYKPGEKAPNNALSKGNIYARRNSREASAKRRPHCKACSGRMEREMLKGVTLESIHARIDELEPGGEELRAEPLQMARAMPINGAGSSADQSLASSSLPSAMAFPINGAGSIAEQPTVSQPAASQPASSQESSHESCRAQLAELTAQLTATKLAFDQSEANGKLIAEEKVALQEQLDHANSAIKKLMDYNDELEQQLAEREALRANAPPAAALDPPAASTTPPLASASLGGGLALLAFPIGSRVYVKRSSKPETIAFVKEYDAGNNVYKLQLTGDDSGNTKQCLEKHMRAAPVEDGHAAATAALGPPQKQPAAGGLAAGSSSGADASDELTAAKPPAPKPPAAASDEPPAAKPPTAKPPAAKRPLPNHAQAAAPPKSPRLVASAHPVKCYFDGLDLPTGVYHCHRLQTAATMRLCAAPNCMESQRKCSAASFHFQCYFDYYTEKMVDLSKDWNPFRCPACDDPVQFDEQ